MKDALIVSVLSVLPRKRGARTLGWFARTGLSRVVTRLFVKAYGVRLEEATGELGDYATLESLFTRELKPGARPVDPEPSALVSPVDGTVAFAGRTQDGRVEVAPGRSLSIANLLGEPLKGEVDVAVLYLSPTDYHRVHVPREGSLRSWRYVPGTLWPVFPAAVRRVDDLFSKNERCRVTFDTAHGPLDVVLVGAFGVGRITLSGIELITNTGDATARGEELVPSVRFERGDELGIFHLGSTVILVAPPGRWRWTVDSGEPVRVGRPMGRVVAPSSDG